MEREDTDESAGLVRFATAPRGDVAGAPWVALGFETCEIFAVAARADPRRWRRRDAPRGRPREGVGHSPARFPTHDDVRCCP